MKDKKKIVFTVAQLNQMVKEGKIRSYEGYVAPEKKTNDSRFNTGELIVRFFPTKSREKNTIAHCLIEWTQVRCLKLYGEYYFHPERKWRFDWCIPELKIAVEYNGIMSEKSRHTTIGGYSGDMNKINAAQALGWRVIQLTPLNFSDLKNQLENYDTGKKS